jgi:hypothetical protein
MIGFPPVPPPSKSRWQPGRFGLSFAARRSAVNMAEYKVDLTDEQIRALQDLAKRRGVKMNEVIQQAISTEKLIADNVDEGDDLLIKKGDRFKKVRFDKKSFKS